MRRLVIGDIHGAYKALIQCFERSEFDYKKDLLISLGDVADGWSETPKCIEELLKVKNLVYVWGNHDLWTHLWLTKGWSKDIWIEQGGRATKTAYIKKPKLMIKHRHFFEIAKAYCLIDNKLFVHGGLYPINRPVEKQELNDLMWDRQLFQAALGRDYDFARGYRKTKKLTEYDEIFLGHTSTINWKTDIPMHACEVWNLDQGAGYHGKLTIMDIDTHEYWQSDIVKTLYPEEKGRR